MKKTYLLILLCCLPIITIFSAEKKEITEVEQQNREDKITTQLHLKHYKEITKLKENHAYEIDLYEQKVAALMNQIEKLEKK